MTAICAEGSSRIAAVEVAIGGILGHSRPSSSAMDFGFPAPILALYKQGLRAVEAAPAP